MNSNENLDKFVNNPSHYNTTPLDTLEVFIMMNEDRPERIMGALEFNIMKYKDRAGKKEGEVDEKDIKKMMWYQNKYEVLFGSENSLKNKYTADKNK